MMLTDQLVATIEDRCRELGLSESEFSRAVAGHNTVLIDIRRGKSPTAKRLRKISEVLGLEFYLGPPRGMTDDPTLVRREGATGVADKRESVNAELKKVINLHFQEHVKLDDRTADILADFADSLAHIVDRLAHSMQRASGPEYRAGRRPRLPQVAFRDGGAGPSVPSSEAFKQASPAEMSMQSLPPAVEDGARALTRAIVEAGGDPVPDDLWPALASTRNHPLGARPVEVVELGAGGSDGADLVGEEVVGSVWFRQDWLERRGLDPSRCVVVRASGDSMEPLLSEGAPILVDRKRRRRVENRIFVVRTVDGLIAKRAGRDRGGKWQLVSEQSSCAPMPWPKDAETIGQAIWTTRSLI